MLGVSLSRGGTHSADDFSYVCDLNVRAVLFMSKAALPYLRAPGRIINVCSVGARLGKNFLSTVPRKPLWKECQDALQLDWALKATPSV